MSAQDHHGMIPVDAKLPELFGDDRRIVTLVYADTPDDNQLRRKDTCRSQGVVQHPHVHRLCGVRQT